MLILQTLDPLEFNCGRYKQLNAAATEEMHNTVDPTHQELFAELSKIFKYNVTDILQAAEIMDGIQVMVFIPYQNFDPLNNYENFTINSD